MPEAGRIGDPSHCPSDAHSCPTCPHDAKGPATSGSPDVVINGRAALRVRDRGQHASCCGDETWEAAKGAPGVFINNRAAHRKGDEATHCGGTGHLEVGSGDVIIGNYVKGDPPHHPEYAGGFQLHDHDGTILPFAAYVIRTRSGKEYHGHADHRGHTCLVFTDEPEDLEVEILPEDCHT